MAGWPKAGMKMRVERFNFDEIIDQASFFCQFSDRFVLTDLAINDLDDLWEVVAGKQLPMPLDIEFQSGSRAETPVWRINTAV